MIDKALISGVEGAVEEEFEIVGRRRRKRTMGQVGDAEKSLDVDSIMEEEEEELGCLEKVPGWLAKLREPFLPDIELRSYPCESLVFQRFKRNIKTTFDTFSTRISLIVNCVNLFLHITNSLPQHILGNVQLKAAIL